MSALALRARRRSSPRSRPPLLPARRPGRRTSATASRAASRVAGPWVVVPRARRGRRSCSTARERQRRRRRHSTRWRARSDVRVTFDGQLGAPGRSRRDDHALRVLPRRLVDAPQRGAFQPLLGCIPSTDGGARTRSPRRVIKPLGAPLDLAAATVPLSAGAVQQTVDARAARRASTLVDTLGRDRVRRRRRRRRSALATPIHVAATVGARRRVVVDRATSEALPRGARARGAGRREVRAG